MPINYINPPMMDETGKAIVAVLTGEEPEESSGHVSLIKAPMSEAKAQTLLDANQNMPRLSAFDPETDKGQVSDRGFRNRRAGVGNHAGLICEREVKANGNY